MEIGEGSFIPPPAPEPSKRHTVLMLKSVTFTGNHPVERDTEGNFAPPEWLSGRLQQWPICYTRGKPVKITATFTVMMDPSAAEDVTVKGLLDQDGVKLEWTGSVHCAPGDKELSTAELTSSAALPNKVGYVSAAFIVFTASAAGEPFDSAGMSWNTLYVMLGDPAGTPPYWTLLDISCQAAAGASTAEAVVAKSFVPFTTRALTRKRDGKGLTYWKPETTRATDTKKLLASGDGSSQCGSWSEFLVDMHKAHGISTSKKIMIVRSLAEISTVGFLVKNWQFVSVGSHPAPFTHKLGTECVQKTGLPGQRNPRPPPAFFNHFIVSSFGKFYDPSYGGGPIADQTSWEVGAIDGLFSRSYAGYPKSANLTTLLLKFV